MATATDSSDSDQTTTTDNSNGDARRRKKRETKIQRSKLQRRKVSASAKPKSKNGLRKTTAANSLLGLSVVLYANQLQYSDVVMNNYYGFKVLVHSPFDFPGVGAKGFAVGGKMIH